MLNAENPNQTFCQLSAENLHLQFKSNPILQGIDLQLSSGEFVGLIGPNGAGKSSLLRVLSGLLTAQQGQVTLQLPQDNPKNIVEISAQIRARFLGYLPQQEKPAWPLTVEHLVGLGRAPWHKPMGNKSTRDHSAVEQALQVTDLQALRKRPVTELSGGELQRCLLARVFAGEPQLILADEPIAALDPYHQLQIMELLQAHAQQGGAVMAALHDLSLASRFCKRLILLHHGRVVADGEPIAVLTPQNLAEVYGITAHVDCRDDGVVIIPRQRTSLV